MQRVAARGPSGETVFVRPRGRFRYFFQKSSEMPRMARARSIVVAASGVPIWNAARSSARRSRAA
jgi:hypothetical protein